MEERIKRGKKGKKEKTTLEISLLVGAKLIFLGKGGGGDTMIYMHNVNAMPVFITKIFLS